MALILAMAEASCAGICDLVSLGMVNAAMIRMMVTTINSSIRVKPRSRLRLRMDVTFLVSSPRSAAGDGVRFGMEEEAAFLQEPISGLLFSRHAMSKPGTSLDGSSGKKS